MRDDFLVRAAAASRDPVVIACKGLMALVDVLLWGRPADLAWNWLCALQNARYRSLLSSEV